jgi:hypothetical protein
MFFGGLENDVRNQLGDQYISMDPLEDNQDSGDIRLYIGKRKQSSYDFIVIGQNGKEVALTTIILLIYVAKFVDEETRQKYRDKLDSFKNSLKVLMSSVTARQEYIAFFNKHRIKQPRRRDDWVQRRYSFAFERRRRKTIRNPILTNH